MADAAVILISIVMMVENYTILLIARFCIGFVSTTYTMHAAVAFVETFPTSLAGLGTMINYSAVTFFILLTFIQQNFYSYDFLVQHWRIILAYPAIFALLRMIGSLTYLNFESPVHILNKYQDDPNLKAYLKENMAIVYSDTGIEDRIEELIQEKRATAGSKQQGLTDFL